MSDDSVFTDDYSSPGSSYGGSSTGIAPRGTAFGLDSLRRRAQRYQPKIHSYGGEQLRRYSDPLPQAVGSQAAGRANSYAAAAAAYAQGRPYQPPQAPEAFNLNLFASSPTDQPAPIGGALGFGLTALGAQPGQQAGGGIQAGLGPLQGQLATTPVTIGNFGTYAREGVLSLITSALEGHRYDRLPGDEQVAQAAPHDGLLDGIVDGMNGIGNAVFGAFDAPLKIWREANAIQRINSYHDLVTGGHATSGFFDWLTSNLFGNGTKFSWSEIVAKAGQQGVDPADMAAELWDLDPTTARVIASQTALTPEMVDRLKQGLPLSQNPLTNLALEASLNIGEIVAGGGMLKAGASLVRGAGALSELGGLGASSAPALAKTLGAGVWTLRKAWAAYNGLTVAGTAVRAGEWGIKQAGLVLGNNDLVHMADQWLWEQPLSTNPGLNLIDAFTVHPIAAAKHLGGEARAGRLYVGFDRSVGTGGVTRLGGEPIVVAGKVGEATGATANTLREIKSVPLEDMESILHEKLDWSPEITRAAFGKDTGDLSVGDLKNGLLYVALAEVRRQAGAAAEYENLGATMAERSQAWVDAHLPEATKLLADNIAGRDDSIWRLFKNEFWERGIDQLDDGSEAGTMGYIGPYRGDSAMASFLSWLRGSKIVAKAHRENAGIRPDATLRLRTDVPSDFLGQFRQRLVETYASDRAVVDVADLHALQRQVPTIYRYGKGLVGRKGNLTPRITRRQLLDVVDEALAKQREIESKPAHPEAVGAILPSEVGDTARVAKAIRVPRQMADAMRLLADDPEKVAGLPPNAVVEFLAAVTGRSPMDLRANLDAEAINSQAIAAWTQRVGEAQQRGIALDALARLDSRLERGIASGESAWNADFDREAVRRVGEMLVNPPTREQLEAFPGVRAAYEQFVVSMRDLMANLGAALDDPLIDAPVTSFGDARVVLPDGFGPRELTKIASMVAKARDLTHPAFESVDRAVLSDPAFNPFERTDALRVAGDIKKSLYTAGERTVLDRLRAPFEQLYAGLVNKYLGPDAPVTNDTVRQIIDGHTAAHAKLEELAGTIRQIAHLNPDDRGLSPELRTIKERADVAFPIREVDDLGWRGADLGRTQGEYLMSTAGDNAARAREQTALEASLHDIDAKMRAVGAPGFAETLRDWQPLELEGGVQRARTKAEAQAIARAHSAETGDRTAVAKVGSRWTVYRARPAAPPSEAAAALEPEAIRSVQGEVIETPPGPADHELEVARAMDRADQVRRDEQFLGELAAGDPRAQLSETARRILDPLEYEREGLASSEVDAALARIESEVGEEFAAARAEAEAFLARQPETAPVAPEGAAPVSEPTPAEPAAPEPPAARDEVAQLVDELERKAATPSNAGGLATATGIPLDRAEELFGAVKAELRLRRIASQERDTQPVTPPEPVDISPRRRSTYDALIPHELATRAANGEPGALEAARAEIDTRAAELPDYVQQLHDHELMHLYGESGPAARGEWKVVKAPKLAWIGDGSGKGYVLAHRWGSEGSFDVGSGHGLINGRDPFPTRSEAVRHIAKLQANAARSEDLRAYYTAKMRPTIDAELARRGMLAKDGGIIPYAGTIQDAGEGYPRARFLASQGDAHAIEVMARVTREENLAKIRADHAAYNARLDELAALPDEALSWPKSNGDGSVIVSADPRIEGGWRTTFLEADGQPTGHVEASSKREAIENARGLADINQPPETAGAPAAPAAELAPADLYNPFVAGEPLTMQQLGDLQLWLRDGKNRPRGMTGREWSQAGADVSRAIGKRQAAGEIFSSGEGPYVVRWGNAEQTIGERRFATGGEAEAFEKKAINDGLGSRIDRVYEAPRDTQPVTPPPDPMAELRAAVERLAPDDDAGYDALVERYGLEAVQQAEAAGSVATPDYGPNAEMVPVEELRKYLEPDRTDLVRGENPQVDEYLNNLRDDIVANGVREPVVLTRYDNGQILLADGNHRVAVAQEAGLTELPTIVRHVDGSEAKPSTILGETPAPRGPSIDVRESEHEASTFAATVAVRELDDVVSSEQPNYRHELQPRQRGRAESQTQIDRMARTLRPDDLLETGRGWTGAPIVTEGGMTVSGNGRMMALRRTNAENLARYKEALVAKATELGLDPAAIAEMRHPVLVQEIPEHFATRDLARRLNVPTGGSTLGERASAVAPEITAADIDALAISDENTLDVALRTGAGAAFARRVLGKLTGQEQRELVENGALTDSGARFIKAALLAKVVEPKVVSRLVDSADGSPIGRIRDGFLASLGQLASAKSLIEDGARYAELDMSPDLSASVRWLDEVRKGGGDPLELLGLRAAKVRGGVQDQLVDANALTPQQAWLSMVLWRLGGTEGGSAKRVTAFLREYANGVRGSADPREMTMFGAEPPSLTSMLREAIRPINDDLEASWRARVEQEAQASSLFGAQVLERPDSARLLSPPPDASGDVTLTVPGDERPVIASQPITSEAGLVDELARRAPAPHNLNLVAPGPEALVGMLDYAEKATGEVRVTTGDVALDTMLSDAMAGDLPGIRRDYDAIAEAYGRLEPAERYPYFERLLAGASEGTLAFPEWLVLRDLAGGSLRRGEDGAFNGTLQSIARGLGLDGRQIVDMLQTARIRVGDRLRFGAETPAAAGDTTLVRSARLEYDPATFEAATGFVPDTTHVTEAAAKLAEAPGHVLATTENRPLAQEIVRARAGDGVLPDGTALLEVSRPDTDVMLNRLAEERAARRQRLEELRRTPDRPALEGRPAEVTPLYAEPDGQVLWERFMGQEPGTIAAYFKADEPHSLGELVDAMESIERGELGELAPDEARRLYDMLRKIVDQRVAEGRASGAAEAADAADMADFQLRPKASRTATDRGRKRDVRDVRDARPGDRPPVEWNPATLPDELEQLGEQLRGIVQHRDDLPPLNEFMGTQYDLGVLPSRSKVTNTLLSPRLIYRDFLESVDRTVPGMAEELLSKRALTPAARIRRTRIAHAFEAAVGGRPEADLRRISIDNFTDLALGRAQYLDPEAFEAARRDVSAIYKAWREQQLENKLQGFPIRRRIALMDPDVLNTVARRTLEDIHGKGNVPDWANVDFAELWRAADNRIRSFFRGKPGVTGDIGRFLDATYESRWGRKFGTTGRVTTTWYHVYRFLMDGRWLALEASEAPILSLFRGGPKALKAGIRPPKEEPFLFGAEVQRRVSQDWSHWFGYLDTGTYMRFRERFLMGNFLTEQPGAMTDTLGELARRDPELRETLGRFGDRPDDWLRRLEADWLVLANRTRRLTKVEAQRAYQPLVDRGVIGPDLADRLRASERYTPIEAIEAELRSTVGDPRVKGLYERLSVRNQELWNDLAELYFGQPDRSNVQRLLNHPLLYWPISYQLKATKWLAGLMFDQAFGVDTASAGAWSVQQLHDEHVRRMANDPDYRDAITKNRTLLFIAQMLLPITPFDIGVSLSPWTRIVLEHAASTADPTFTNPYSRNLFGVGPGYTYFQLLPRLFAEQQKEGALGAGTPVGDVGRAAFPLTTIIDTSEERTGAKLRNRIDYENALAAQGGRATGPEPLPDQQRFGP